MAFRVFRFRRFSSQLLALLLGLLFTALATTYILVSHFNDKNARDHGVSNLEVGDLVFKKEINQIVGSLADSASVMSQDYPIRQVVMRDKLDPVALSTLSSILKTYTRRVHAPVIALFDTSGKLIANSDAQMDNENREPFRYLIRLATEQDKDQQSGFAYLNGALYILVVKPLYGPYPEIIDWFGLAFPIDRVFAHKIKATTRLEVTFASTDKPESPRVLASTLPEDSARLVAQAAAKNKTALERIKILSLPGDRYVTLFRNEDLLGDDPVTVVLQQPLSVEQDAADILKLYLQLISLAALAAATLLAFWIARGVSQPVQQLAAYTKHVAAGDYTQRIDLPREDELGQLATAFNQMTAGLAERDQVRDLLGKVVSPEIATQLLHSGVRLGGEERVVTILFSDLRDFTAMSEKMAPADMLALLNRYLDRMSTIIEKHGGVIDKYIGDAIMALFGAPVADPNAPARAIAAAREMAQALDKLNQELAREGRPALTFGIGINTARVVAGNMGSKTRLNYTVIGDGVNLASRLEGLTKEPAYRTLIIVSEATLRALKDPPPARELGEVKVKGKAEVVKIFAIGTKGESQPPGPP